MLPNDRLDAFSRLLQLLYSSLPGAEPWVEFLEALSEHLNARYATLILTPPYAKTPGVLLTPGVDAVGIANAITYFQMDPFTGLPEGKVVSIRDFVSERNLKESDFYKLYLSTAGTGDILGIDLRASSGFEMRLRICQAEGKKDFGDEEHATLQRLVPHLRAALAIFEKLETDKSEYSVYSGAVEQLSVGTVVLDHDGNILRCNNIAAAILAEKDGISLAGRRLALNSPDRESEFRHQLKAMRQQLGEGSAPPPYVMRLERPSGRRDLGLVVKPIAIPGFMQTGSSPAVAIFVTDPDRQVRITSEAIADLFDLTRMEAEISACFSNGLSLSQTAKALGIAENTVRAHLRSVFTKIGVTRQSQLVHKIHTSLPELVASRGPANAK